MTWRGRRAIFFGRLRWLSFREMGLVERNGGRCTSWITKPARPRKETELSCFLFSLGGDYDSIGYTSNRCVLLIVIMCM